jgi:germination protein, Ger(x)C family
MRPVKRALVLLLTVSMLCLTGCWNYREPENLSMVTGIAVDKGQNGYKYHLTFEFLDPTQQQTGAELLETDGNTIFDAVRNAVSISERRLYFADAKVLILSKEVASEGVSPLFDWVARDQEPRITMIPVISKEKTAGELFQLKGITNPLVSYEIWRTITQNKQSLSETSSVQVYEAIDLLGGEGDAMVLAAVKSTKQQGSSSPELDGTAVFKKDKLVGYLGREESKFFLFIRNEVQGGLLVFSPKNDGQNITLTLQGNRTAITPEISGDSASIKIKLNVRASLGENGTSENYVDADGLAKVEASAENYLESGIRQLIQKVQTQYDSDIFGFGSNIHQSDPDYWSKHKADWDKQFKNLKCKVDVNVNIDNTANARDTIKVG